MFEILSEICKQTLIERAKKNLKKIGGSNAIQAKYFSVTKILKLESKHMEV